MADDRAKITIDSEIDTGGIDKGFKDIDKKIAKSTEKTQKEFEKVEGAVEDTGKAAAKAAEEAVRAVEDAAVRQIAAIKSGEQEKLDAIKSGDAAQLAEVTKAAKERIALLEQEKSRLDESVYNERIEAIRREEQAKTNEIKRGSREREALIKKDAERQVKAVKDGEKNQLEEIKKSNTSKLRTVKDGEKNQLEEIKKSNTSKLQAVKEFGDKADQSLSKLASFLSTGGLSALGLGVAAAGVKQMVSTLNEWGQAALQQEMITGRLNAVLKSTGADAWVSSTLLQKMANEQVAATGKSKEEITEMQAVLLGFRSVTRDVFGDATMAVLNATAVMGGSLVSTANSLGKALDTPLEGMAALARQGVVFSEQQKELVKVLEETGRHEEAQRIILKEFQTAYGDAATVISDAAQAQIKYNNALDSLKKNVGKEWNNLFKGPKEAVANFFESINQSMEKKNAYSEAQEYMGRVTQEATVKINAEKQAIEELNRMMEDAGIAEANIYEKKIKEHERNIRFEEQRDERRRWYSEQNIVVLQHELDLIDTIGTRKLSPQEMREMNSIRDRLEQSGQTFDQRKKELEFIMESIRQQMAWDAEQKISEADDNKTQQDEIARQETIANKREEIRKALEQEIALITKKAKLEGKNIQSEEIQKQILNARVNAYTALIKEFGDAGEEEKRTFAELRAEYAQLDVEAADRLQGDNLKNLERQKQEILEKAELEDRAVDSLEVRKELLDAEVQAYGNQLKILRELIDGTAEEDTVRRRALQASWDQYRAEQMTAAAQKRRLEDLAEAQKKRLEDLAKAQKNFAGSASSLYESAVKEAKDSENQRNSEKLSDAEKKAMEDYQKWFLPFWTDTQRQREAAAVTAINNAAEHEKLMAKQTADDKISKTQKEWEELQKNKEKQTEWIADHNREVEEKYRLTVEKINKQATTEQKTYRAETDDTLKDIAQKYGTTIKAILALNKEIKNPDIIYPGQVITISEGLTPEEKNDQLLAAEADKNKNLLNLEAGKDEAMKQAMIQAENQYTKARTLIYKEMDDQIVAIEEDTNEKIKNLDKTKWEQLKQNASDYLNVFTQAANSLFSIWNSVIDAELEAKLRENDEMVQSDEEREKREKELRREAAMDKYKADVAQYAMNIILANGQAALGVLTAQAQSGPPGAIVAAVLGALNVALVVAAKPKPPRFHQGGVAQGASGQEVPAVLKAGEVVLTPSQFQNTMAAIAQLAHGNGGGDGVSLNVDVKNYSSGARVEKPVFDRGALHMIIRDEVNTMYGSGELDRGIARKESRDRGIIIE